MQSLARLALVAFTTLLVACSGAGADAVITDGLNDPSSYQRHSYNEMWKGKDSQGRPAYVAMVSYSATNAFGGRIRDCKLVAWAQVGNQVFWGGQAMTGCLGSSVEENRGQLDYFLDWNGFRSEAGVAALEVLDTHLAETGEVADEYNGEGEAGVAALEVLDTHLAEIGEVADEYNGEGEAEPWHSDIFTIVLFSEVDKTAAEVKNEGVRKAGFEAELIESADYTSLASGYWVVIVGQYYSTAQAADDLQRMKNAGFSDAYVKKLSNKS